MKGLSLESAINALRETKNGKASAKVVIDGVAYLMKTSVKFVSGLATGIQNGELLNPTNDKLPSVRNIDKNKFEHPFLALAQRMVFDTTTGAAVDPATANYKDDAPSYFKNGELHLAQGEAGSLSLPMSVLANNYASTSNKDDFFEHVPFLIRPEKSTSLKTEVSGSAPANVAYRWEVYGVEFIKA